MAGTRAADAREVAAELRALSARHRTKVLRPAWWNERLLDWSMSHPSFKTQLFRFVDVFPATTGDDDVARHLSEYLGLAELPRALELGVPLVEQLRAAAPISAAVARRGISRMARQFIAGSTVEEAVARLGELRAAGRACTVDVLGEKTLTAAEADRYVATVRALLDALVAASASWPADSRLDEDDLGPIPRVNVSIKPTALTPHFSSLSAARGLAEAAERLTPVLEAATRAGALVHLDMEHYEVKAITLDLLERIVADRAYEDLHLGITIQGYLRDAGDDLDRVLALSAGRRRPICVRLVKGAYWDTETIHAVAEGWPVPVHEDKAATDANFARLAAVLHDHHRSARVAFGSHSLDSIAEAVAAARARGIPDNGYEIQMLYGMGESYHEAIQRLGLRLRIYAPIGELIPGMAYLVRRLLENTANESFVRTGARDGAALRPAPEPEAPAETSRDGLPAYRPEPPARWFVSGVRDAFAAAVERVGPDVPVPAIIGGEPVRTAEEIRSEDPAFPERTVAISAACGVEEAERALEAARAALPAWRRAPAIERAGVLQRAAAWMRERRFELAALEVFEAGKPWAEADGDVCEAIDFCEYYAHEMLRLDEGATVLSPPGEQNAMHYHARGIGVVIAPWNFPLAIPTGMVVAALVCGNAVLFKPAEQTPLVAAQLVEALRAGGLPDGVLAFLPGVGEVVGAYLVEHPEIAFVAFTGSKAVGLSILERAAVVKPGQRDIRRVVVELGGKNALIVDADADLDQAVPIAVASAFGYSGQKCSACSRLIVLRPVYEAVLDRLAGVVDELRIGHPLASATQVGPLIDEEAYRRVRGYVERASEFGNVVRERRDLPDAGWYVGPTVVRDVAPGSPLATEEIFGPVLAVMPADSIEEAVALANATDYALTGGLISRSPANVDFVTAELRAGNVYVNRPITGAIVGRHPFGGYGLSGVGSKAGGPDYLLQFLEPRATSENTVRQGAAPAESAASRS